MPQIIYICTKSFWREFSVTFPFTAFSNICIRTHINQNDDKSITVNQESYAKTINPIHLNKDQISPSTTPSRRTAQLQRTAGKTNLACWNIQTRKKLPDM